MFRNRIIWSVAVLVGISFVADVAWAQRGKGKEKPKKQKLSLDGTFQGSSRNLIKVTGKDAQWLVQLRPPSRKKGKDGIDLGTEIEITGEADASVLRPRMFVQLSGNFSTKTFSSTEPIGQLKVISLRSPYTAGVVIENGAGDDAEGQSENIDCLVVGRIVSFKKGRLTLFVGKKKPIVAELTDDVSITVDFNDLRMATLGDNIHVEGHYFQQGQMYADVVKIEMVKPFSLGKGKNK